MSYLARTLRYCLAVFLLFAVVSAHAATCTVGSGVSTIGTELFATRDYGNGRYNYNITILMCSGGVVSYFNGTDMVDVTPEQAIQANKTFNMTRVLRNQCGSMGLVAHDNFKGTINDTVVSVNFALSALPLSQTYYDKFKKGIAPGESYPLICPCPTGQLMTPFGGQC